MFVDGVTCNYCGKSAVLTTGQIIYPHREDLKFLKFWQCVSCDAYVGCHKNSKDYKPLGILANRELRQLRIKAHGLFDLSWRSGKITRDKAYQRLSQSMGIKKKDCHIGHFNIDQCEMALNVLIGKNKL